MKAKSDSRPKNTQEVIQTRQVFVSTIKEISPSSDGQSNFDLK